MDFEECYKTAKTILMEGAIGERLKREYQIKTDSQIALAGLVYNEEAVYAMRKIFLEYLSIAENYRLPFIATTPTRRANREQVIRAGFSEKIISDNIGLLKQIKECSNTDMYIGGLMGCKGDAYRATQVLSEQDAQEFHSWQANLFMLSGADFLYAGIMPALPEAVGMARAMENTGLPYIISFMIRNNGRLIDGTTINDAIIKIDGATNRKPICYMTNCVHPKVLIQALSYPFNQTELVKERFRGIQANTSPLPPDELDNSTDLKSSDSVSLARDMMEISNYIAPKIYGGCCGTDNTHIEEIAKKISNINY